MSHFIVYGDSVASGYGVPPGKGFVNDLTASLRRHSPNQYAINLSAPGWTTSQVTAVIESSLPQLTSADFIGIYVGGDDLIQSAPRLLSQPRSTLPILIRTSQARYIRMLKMIRRYSKKPILVGSIYNPYPNTPEACVAIQSFNSRVIEPAARAIGARIAPVAEAFNGAQSHLIAGFSDGRVLSPGQNGIRFPVHPNSAGCRVIANAYVSVL